MKKQRSAFVAKCKCGVIVDTMVNDPALVPICEVNGFLLDNVLAGRTVRMIDIEQARSLFGACKCKKGV